MGVKAGIDMQEKALLSDPHARKRMPCDRSLLVQSSPDRNRHHQKGPQPDSGKDKPFVHLPVCSEKQRGKLGLVTRFGYRHSGEDSQRMFRLPFSDLRWDSVFSIPFLLGRTPDRNPAADEKQ